MTDDRNADPKDWPPKFTVDPGQILRLLTGEAFYSSADAALREGILNSIDATIRQGQVDPKYSPAIRIEFDRENGAIAIADNGTGMTQEDVSSLFAKVGASAARFYNVAQQLRGRLVGEFGIGVMSYFLASDSFEVQTKSEDASAIGLLFESAMLDANKVATIVPPRQQERGTTVTLKTKSNAIFEQLRTKYSHWVRDSQYVRAYDRSTGEEIPQGGMGRRVRAIPLELPEWIVEAHIGPPEEMAAWTSLDGRAHLDVLYSGVFVERIEIDKFWCVEGAIHVDPKHFRPKLNREGFVGEKLREELGPFIQGIHPRVLEAAAPALERALAENPSAFSSQRLATLWMAIPRGPEYRKAAELWDEAFRNQKVFRKLLAGDDSQSVSVNDIKQMTGVALYLAPMNLPSQPELVRHATRLLRDSGQVVLQGIDREGGYLNLASLSYSTTEQLLSAVFSKELPALTPIAGVAQGVLAKESTLEVSTQPLEMKIVPLGPSASPLLLAGAEVWINPDHPNGTAFLRDLASGDGTFASLVSACIRSAPNMLPDIVRLCGGKHESFVIWPLRRNYLRALYQ